MNKIRYYAPYLVTVIVLVLAIIVYMSFFRPYPFVKLPELAATLESNEYFLREDGAVMKNAGKSDAYPAASPVETTEAKPYKVRNLKAKPINEMLPHEYAALISEKHIFVRKDGKVFTTDHEYTIVKPYKAYLREVCTPSELPENASVAEFEIENSIHASIGVFVPINDTAATAKGYISVKLADGWYTIASGTGYALMVNDEQELGSKLSLAFPALHEGKYRLEFDIGGKWSYKEMTLTRKDTDNYTTFTIKPWSSG